MLSSGDYEIARLLIERGLGLLYFVGLAAALPLPVASLVRALRLDPLQALDAA